jgi:hypothetical protein
MQNIYPTQIVKGTLNVGTFYSKTHTKNPIKPPGTITLRLQVVPATVPFEKRFKQPAFSKIPIYKAFNLQPAHHFVFNVRIIKAFDIPYVDIIGSCDPYILGEILDRDFYANKSNKPRTFTVYNSVRPYYNEMLQFKIESLRTDIVRLSIIDADLVSKDDPVSYHDFKMTEVGFGEIHKKVIKFTRYPNADFPPERSPGSVKLIYQLTAPNQMPFDTEYINPVTSQISQSTNITNNANNDVKPELSDTKPKLIDDRKEEINDKKVDGKVVKPEIRSNPLAVFKPNEGRILLRNMDNMVMKEGMEYYFLVGLKSDCKGYKFYSKNEDQPSWDDIFTFLLTNEDSDSIVFELFEEKSASIPSKTPSTATKIGEASVCLEGLREEGSGIADFGALGQLHFIYEERPYIFNPNSPSINIVDNLEKIRNDTKDTFAKKFDYTTLNVEIFEGVNIPIMDKNSTDPFVQILHEKTAKKLLQKPIACYHGRLYTKTLNPTWNQVFSMKVQNIITDVFTLNLFDYDKIKNDQIYSKNLPIHQMKFGHIYEDTINNKLFYRYQLLPPQCPRLFSNNYEAYSLHVKFLEGYDFTEAGEYYCVLRIDPETDLEGLSTLKTRKTFSPQWFSEHVYNITPNSHDISIELKTDNIGKDIVRHSYHYNLQDFLGENLKKTKLIEEKAVNGTIRFLMQATLRDDVGFLDYIEEDPKVTSDKLMCHIKIIDATNVPKTDAGTHLCDPYVVIELPQRKENLDTDLALYDGQYRFQTRVLENTLSPTWNQCFHFNIQSIATQRVKLSLFDYDKVSKDDLIGSFEFSLLDYVLGIPINSSAINVNAINNNNARLGMISEENVKVGKANLHFKLQICQPGQISFQEQPFSIPRLLVHIGHNFVIPEKLNCYGRLRLQGDHEYQYTKIEPPFDHNFKFYVGNYQTDEFEIELCSHDTTIADKTISFPNGSQNSEDSENNTSIVQSDGNKRFIKLSKLQMEERIQLDGDLTGIEIMATMKPDAEINENNFAPIGAKSSELFNLFINATNGVFSMGRTGYVYFKFSFIRKDFINNNGQIKEAISSKSISDYSRIINTRDINSIISLPIISLNTDVLTIQLFEYKFDEYPKPKIGYQPSKTNVLGEASILLKDIGFGIINNQTIKLSPNGEINLTMNLAQPNAIPFSEMPFVPYKLKIMILEATDVPKMDLMSKSDPYLEFWLENDVSRNRTKTLENTLTPQWMETTEFILTNLNETLHLRLMDENVGKDKEISSGSYNFSQLQVGVPKEEWIEMNSSTKKMGGKVNVIFCLMTWGVPDIDISDLLC